MKKDNTHSINSQVEIDKISQDLHEIVRIGAQQMLQLAIEAEITEFIDSYSSFTEENGYRLVVKNGHHKARSILTPLGPLQVRQPRIDDPKLEKYGVERFSSQILPRYMRRTPTIDNLIPILYLKGISTQDFPTALSAILGDSVKGLSPNTIGRLKKQWEDEYKQWNKRDLSGKRYVYIWADGVHFNVRLMDAQPCILVIIGASESGEKELLAVVDGHRESEISWADLLLDLKSRGLTMPPSLAIADGALGFWAALEKIFPETLQQRCWVHKAANILDKLPKKIQSAAKSLIHEMYLADKLIDAKQAFNRFCTIYRDKYPKAVLCLEKDADQLFTFYRFPAAHWIHI